MFDLRFTKTNNMRWFRQSTQKFLHTIKVFLERAILCILGEIETLCILCIFRCSSVKLLIWLFR